MMYMHARQRKTRSNIVFGDGRFNIFNFSIETKLRPKTKFNKAIYKLYSYIDKSTYIGETDNGILWRTRNGKGTMTYDNGKYEGDFKDNKRGGKGVYYFADGDKYDGDWKDDKKDGKGVFYFADGDKYEGYWKDDKFDGKGVYYFKNGNRYEGDWKDDKIVKKRKIGKTNNTKSKQTKLFYQINENDKSKKIKPEEYKILRDINQQNEFINNKKNIIPNEHIKINYNDHGDNDRSLQENINKELFTNIINKDTKSFYISSNACYGGFYDKKGTNLFDIVKEQIKDTQCIGFVSIKKKEYSNTIKNTINNAGETGVKRIPNNQKGVNIDDVYENKDDYFEYYCILNEKNQDRGQMEQNIYKIPSQLCYWREDLIEQEDKTYGNKFIAALTALKHGKPYSFTTYVDENGKQIKKEITIDWRIKDKNREKTANKVKIEEIPNFQTNTNYKQYKITEIKHQEPQATTLNLNNNKNQQNNIG